MRFILFIIGLALSLDGLYCGYMGSMGVGELIIVADGVIFLLWSSFYDAAKKVRFLRFFKTLFVVVMAVFVVYSCMICAIGKFDSDKGGEDYAIVLGSPLKDNEPTETLKNRLDTTVKYLNGHPAAKAIVSGTGTEAAAMRNYLIVQGIDEERIAVNEAENTYATFQNAASEIDGSATLITSEFHVLRSVQMAHLCGLKDITHIGSETPLLNLPPNCARELLSQIYAFKYYLP